MTSTTRSLRLQPARRRGLTARIFRRFFTVGALMRQLRRTGRWWLIPLVVILLATATLLVVVQIVEYAAPFVYTLF